MKKLLAILLVLVMLVCASSAAMAQTVDIAAQGLTMDIPDGYETILNDESDVETVLLFKPAGEDPARYEFAMSESEEHAQRWMEELNEADREDLFNTFSADLYDASFAMESIADLDWMVIRDGKSTEVIYVTLIYGYMCQIVGMRDDGEALTEAQAKVAEQMVASLKTKELQENPTK